MNPAIRSQAVALASKHSASSSPIAVLSVAKAFETYISEGTLPTPKPTPETEAKTQEKPDGG